MSGGSGVITVPGVVGGTGVTIEPSVVGTGGSPQTLGLQFMTGALDPRVTFTRATTATVTDWEGLIKNTKSGEARFDGMRRVENLLPYSQDFSNAVWTKTNATVSADAITAPDGTLTADKLTEDATSNFHYMQSSSSIPVISGGNYSFSIYVKYNGRAYISVGFSGGASLYAVFNVQTGVVATTNPGVIASITTVGNGWYRCVISGTTNATGGQFQTFLSNGSTIASYLGDGVSGIYIWGAQLENVTGQTNQNPSEYVSTNAIRRNLLTYSEQFDNAAWPKNNVTVSANTSIAPDSTNTGDLVIPNLGTNTGGATIREQTSITSGVKYTFSFYAKSSGGIFTSIAGFDSRFGGGDWVTFTLSGNGSYVVTGTAWSFVTITAAANGWYRCTMTATATSSAIADTILYIGSVAAVVGDGTSGIYVWGAQLEASPAATAYQKVTDAGPQDFNNYQGAAVDGVQYFPYTNPNCIINGVITQIPTIAINSSNSKFAYNCVASGDYFSTPSATANQITGDLSLLVQVALDDWTPATVQTLIAKDGVTSQRSYAFNVQTSGALRLNYSTNGSTITSITSTASTGFVDGTVHFVGVQREAATGIVRFYTSEDGTTFTQLGTDQTGTAGSLFNSTTAVQFGNLSSLAFELNGKIYDSHIYTGLKFTGSSTMVVDFDPSDWTSGTSWVGPETGETWTINGNAKIYQGLWDAVGPKSLLIEEARTNLLTYSSDFSNVAWTKADGTITADTTIAPDGTLTGDTFTTALTTHAIYAIVTVTASTTYTFSWYAKAGTITPKYSVRNKTGAADIISPSAYPIGTPVGNGWFRYLATFTTPVGCVEVIVYPVRDSGTTGTIYLWGAQLEQGAFATSYIPTTSAQVTRNAEQATITGSNFSSWYNQTEGTVYADGDTNASVNAKLFYRIGPAGAGAVGPYGNSTNVIFDKNGTGLLLTFGSALTASVSTKTIMAYSSAGISAAVNGGTVQSTATTVGGSGTALYIGTEVTGPNNMLNGHIRTIRYYSQRLPNTTLQSLTA